MNADRTVIEAFIVPERRSRYLGMLDSKRGREKLLAQLAHFRHFDTRFIESIPPSSQTREAIYRLLIARGAQDKCFVISENSQLDGQELELRAALNEVVGQGQGTILYSLPGPVAFYEGEEQGQRRILARSR